MKQRIRLTESDLHRIVKESVKRILREEILPDSHKISPILALANYLRVSPKNIEEVEKRRYGVFPDKYHNGMWEESWIVYGSEQEAEDDVRSWAPDYCEGATDDDYWYRAGYEKTKNGDFDWEEIANDIIDQEGIEWFLSSYDGTSVELPGGYVGYRCD